MLVKKVARGLSGIIKLILWLMSFVICIFALLWIFSYPGAFPFNILIGLPFIVGILKLIMSALDWLGNWGNDDD